MNESAGEKVTPVSEVLIVYEDVGTALRTKGWAELLPAQFRAKADVSTKYWKLNMLREPFLREQAAAEAAAAGAVILSVHEREAMPREARQWIEGWQEHKKERPYALGVVLDRAASGENSPILDYMREAATRAGASLFYGFGTGRTSGEPARWVANE